MSFRLDIALETQDSNLDNWDQNPVGCLLPESPFVLSRRPFTLSLRLSDPGLLVSFRRGCPSQGSLATLPPAPPS
jgi:hypothetical protein